MMKSSYGRRTGVEAKDESIFKPLVIKTEALTRRPLVNMFTKSLMVASLLSVSGFAMAQEPVSQTNPVKAELQKDNQEVRQDKEKLQADKKAGASKEQIKADKKALKEARKERKEDRKKIKGEMKEEKKEVK